MHGYRNAYPSAYIDYQIYLAASDERNGPLAVAYSTLIEGTGSGK